MFRPEAALLQWLYLAGMKRSTVTPAPPQKVDMGQLDEEHLNHLAQRWQLQAEFEDLARPRRSLSASAREPDRPFVTVDARPHTAAAVDGVAARERLFGSSGEKSLKFERSVRCLDHGRAPGSLYSQRCSISHGGGLLEESLGR